MHGKSYLNYKLQVKILRRPGKHQNYLDNIMVYQYFGVAYTINLGEILTFSCEILCHLAWFVFRKCIGKTRLMNLVT